MYLKRGNKKATLFDSPTNPQKTKQFLAFNSKQEIQLKEISTLTENNKKEELLIPHDKENKSQRNKTIKKLKFAFGTESKEKQKSELEKSQKEEFELEINEIDNPLETNMSCVAFVNNQEIKKATDDTDLKIIDLNTDAKKNLNFENKINENSQEKLENVSSTKDKKSAKNILIDGLKVKMANYSLSHEDFILNLYNSKHKEVQKEIKKFFVIEKPKITEKENNQNNKNNNGENDNKKTRKNNLKNKSKNETQAETNKPAEASESHDAQEKSSIEATDTSLSVNLSKKSTQNLIQNEENKGEKDIEEEKETQVGNDLGYQIKLKYSLLIRFLQLIAFFFKTEYRLINIFVKQFNVVTKTTMWTLIVFRLFVSLTICAMLSARGENEGKSSTVSIFF